jgi:hypothetical protein
VSSDINHVYGINAYDMVLSKVGQGFSTQYNAEFTDSKNSLRKSDMSAIIRSGVYNIPTVLSNINNKNNVKSYYYKRIVNLKSKNDDAIEELQQAFACIEAEEHSEALENVVHEIPTEQLGYLNLGGNNSINSLEV